MLQALAALDDATLLTVPWTHRPAAARTRRGRVARTAEWHGRRGGGARGVCLGRQSDSSRMECMGPDGPIENDLTHIKTIDSRHSYIKAHQNLHEMGWM